MNEVFGGEKLSCEEYLDAQMVAGRDIRGWFSLCHREVLPGFAGQIERITQKNICFKRIYVSGMYMAGKSVNNLTSRKDDQSHSLKEIENSETV